MLSRGFKTFMQKKNWPMLGVRHVNGSQIITQGSTIFCCGNNFFVSWTITKIVPATKKLFQQHNTSGPICWPILDSKHKIMKGWAACNNPLGVTTQAAPGKTCLLESGDSALTSSLRWNGMKTPAFCLLCCGWWLVLICCERIVLLAD